MLEGFEKSTEGNLFYEMFIADGESSIFNQIQVGNPYKQYGVRVQKVECKNYFLRNAANGVIDISNSGKCGDLKKTVRGSSIRFQTAAKRAIDYRLQENTSFDEKVQNLTKGIYSIPSHVFGEHKDCASLAYFCGGNLKPRKVNLVGRLRERGVFSSLQKCVNRLAFNASTQNITGTL